MSAGKVVVASTTAFALSTPSGTVNSTNWLVTPSTRWPPPGASVVTDSSNGACAGPDVTASSSVSGTVSGYRVGLDTTGTSTEVAPGPVNTVTWASSANIGTLSGSLVVTRRTKRWPARRWCAMAKHGGCMS